MRQLASSSPAVHLRQQHKRRFHGTTSGESAYVLAESSLQYPCVPLHVQNPTGPNPPVSCGSSAIGNCCVQPFCSRCVPSQHLKSSHALACHTQPTSRLLDRGHARKVNSVPLAAEGRAVSTVTSQHTPMPSCTIS